MKPTPSPSLRPRVLYQDTDCAVVDKPAGVLVYPPEGHRDEMSLASWWQTQPGVAQKGWIDTRRAGIVHRLDKDTSGTLLLAKDPEALAFLQKQFHDRKVTKKYWAVVDGRPTKDHGRLETKIARHASHRTKQRSSLIDFGAGNARTAISNYRLIDTAEYQKQPLVLLEFQILTGRTHQVRLHAKTLRCPILGDYDYNTKPSKRLSKELNVARQMLHARELTFTTLNNQKVTATAPLPKDMRSLLAKLRIASPH